MIRVSLILFICLSQMLVFSSCNNDDDDDDNDEVANNEDPEDKEPEFDIVPEFFPGTDDEESYGTVKPKLTEIADRTSGVSSPSDLEFYQNDASRSHELWVLNPDQDNTGGSTAIIYDAGKSSQSSEFRRDGNAWHFMALATSLAFGDNGLWATAQGIQDANRAGGIFTGPSLWPGDLDEYAKIGNPPTQRENGSHYDMIHQSPYGMGIAHEKDNIYWVFDGYNGDVVKYDFKEPHYPGGADHTDGEVYRYREVRVSRDMNNVPSHMILDKENGILYIVDTGNDRVLHLDINTGSPKASPEIPLANREPLAVYEEMEGADWGVFADVSGIPSGIALNENRLFVGDYESGKISVFDTDTKELLTTLETGLEGITGLVVGPEGKLWFAHEKESKIYRIDPVEDLEG